MLKNKSLLGTLAVILFVVLSTSQLFSMPNFARKYSMDCTACHNPIPRLNEFGFKFRAAGYRLPEEIGKDASSDKVGDYFAGRTQINWALSRSESPTGVVTNSNQFTLKEITLYPITGSFGKYISSLVEMSFASDEAAELENAYVKATFGEEQSFFTVKAGLFHPFEGYGASDRPLGLTRPLFQSKTAAGTNFKPWGFDQAGIELGYSINNTFFRATVFNGLNSDGNAAQGGGLKKSSSDPSFNNKDFQFTVTHILTDNGGGIGGYVYVGYNDLSTGGATPSLYQDNFKRYALYASYPVADQVLVLGGYQKGQDDDVTGNTFDSNGFFGELNYKVNDPLWLGVRYAQFDPSETFDNNKVDNITAVVNYSFNNGLQLIGEYNYTKSEKGLNLDQKDNSFNLRIIYIY